MALARLALPAVTVTAAAAALSQLFGWFYYPFFATGDSAFGPQYFELTGTAFAAWTLPHRHRHPGRRVIRKVVAAIAAGLAASAPTAAGHAACTCVGFTGSLTSQRRPWRSGVSPG